MRRTLFRVVLFAVVVAALVLSERWWGRLVRPAPPDPFLTASAAIGDVVERVTATGTLKPSRLVAVGAQASGRILKLPVRVGDAVRAGDLIAEIDAVTQNNALRTAMADLDSARAQLAEKEASAEKAGLILKRKRELTRGDVSARSDLESAEADAKTANAQVEQIGAAIRKARVAVEAAEANLAYTRVTAPIDGTILAVVSQEGQTVNATQSTPTIVVLGELKTMIVRAEISEADVSKVAAGRRALYSTLGEPDRKAEATLETIEPAPESVVSDSSITSSSSSNSSSSSSEAIYYNAVFSVPNPDGRLRTYMTIQVDITSAEVRGVPTMPASALGTKLGEKRYQVRVVDKMGPPVTREVEIGLDDKATVEIRSGIKVGERVIIGEKATETKTVVEKSNDRRGPPPPMGF